LLLCSIPQKNSSFHRTIKRSPYKALFGTEPKTGLHSSHILKELLEKLVTKEDLDLLLNQQDHDIILTPDLSAASLENNNNTSTSNDPPASELIDYNASTSNDLLIVKSTNNNTSMSHDLPAADLLTKKAVNLDNVYGVYFSSDGTMLGEYKPGVPVSLSIQTYRLEQE